LFYFTYLYKSDLKLRFLHLICTNMTVNTGKVINILEGIAATKTA